jgi:hypothetical protein
MARTVLSFYNNYEKAVHSIEDLLANDYDPELIKIAFEPANQTAFIEYDYTKEQAPLLEFRELTFGAEITEEDAEYYADRLDKGDIIIGVHVPTDTTQEGNWEEDTSETIGDFMMEGGAYDHEIRKVYSNRGLTTYPQMRWIDPTMGRQTTVEGKDRIYKSRSPLNDEVSNVLGVPDHTDYAETIEELSGRRVLNATEMLALHHTRAKKK